MMDADPRRFTAFSTGVLFCCILLGALFADLLTKNAAFRCLQPGTPYFVIPGALSFTLSLNSGAVFGIGQGMRVLFIVFTFVAMVGILWMLWAHGRSSRVLTSALALVLGGALGNLWDRIFNSGQVRDFIDVYWGRYHWPTFNVADMAICIGAGLIILHSLFSSRHETKRTDEEPKAR